MNANFYVAIMAGGVGSRFWPASRENRPKQFLDITNEGTSLLQQTVSRVMDIVPKENILIVSNTLYKDLILEQLPVLEENQILLEPSRNNTAPCVAYTALHLQAINKDAVFAMLPADHIIKKTNVFASCLQRAFIYARENTAIVTLGITPTRPDTGYGYINYNPTENSGGVHEVHTFKEKPTQEIAQSYLDDGGYLWNAGIFVWSVNTIIEAFRKSSNEILQVLLKNQHLFGSEREQEYINEVYPNTPKISVDFAILERADNVYTIPADIGWSDIGTWNSLYDFMSKDDSGNVLMLKNKKLEDMNGNLIRSSNPDKIIVAKGLSNYIIIDDGNALLIYPRDEEQAIKGVRSSIQDKRYL
ncbi:MAG: mannose-1-phosphate guanylyltransferase [Saprospiraceae bacterium]|jgi:mannose-1-phosphate guanylyltransferase